MVSEEMMREAQNGLWSRKQRKLLFDWAERVADLEFLAANIVQRLEELGYRR